STRSDATERGRLACLFFLFFFLNFRLWVLKTAGGTPALLSGDCAAIVEVISGGRRSGLARGIRQRTQRRRQVAQQQLQVLPLWIVIGFAIARQRQFLRRALVVVASRHAVDMQDELIAAQRQAIAI